MSGYHKKEGIGCPICGQRLTRRADFDVADATLPDKPDAKVYDFRYDSALVCGNCHVVFPTFFDRTSDPKALYEFLGYIKLDKKCQLCHSPENEGMGLTHEGVKPDFGDLTVGTDDKPEKQYNVRYRVAEVCLNPKCGYLYPVFKEVLFSQKIVCGMCRKDHLIPARKANLVVAEVTSPDASDKSTSYFITYDSALLCDCCGTAFPTFYGKTLSDRSYDKSIDFSGVPCELCGSKQMATKPNVRPDFGDIVDHASNKIFDLRYDTALVCVNPDCSYIRPFKKMNAKSGR